MKPGDTVRYLNAVGGGKIVRIDGKTAYVDDDGFETPVLLKDLVVVMPAGYEPQTKGAKLMFDQGAFDAGKKQPEAPKADTAPKKETSVATPVVETEYGDTMSLALAFEPSDLKQLSTSSFNAVLVNDSNYFLWFTFLRRADDDRGWTCEYTGEVGPNELIDLAQYRHENLLQIEHIAIQGVAYKKDKPFAMQKPVNFRRKLNLSKFYKLHCFRPGKYFEDPVLEMPLDTADEPDELPAKIELKSPGTRSPLPQAKAKADKKKKNGDNPHKLLPLIEVDLHINELTDTTAGMSNTDMLNMQLDAVSRTMEQHRKRIGQKIVFIHGKGEGVLRKAVLDFLKKHYPTAELQDASFAQYGFGATLVTIHNPR